MASSCSGLEQIPTAVASFWQHCFLWLSCSFIPLLYCGPWALGGRVLEMPHLWLTTLVAISALWPVLSLRVNSYTKVLLLCKDLRAALMHGYRDKNLEDSLILCPLRKVTVLGSPSGPLSSLVMGSWSGLKYQVHVSFCGVGLKFIQQRTGLF